MILIDSREDSILSGAVIKLCEEQKIEYKKQWLEIGDYVMSANKTVAVEAKSSGDFLASVRNQRVFNQASNMLDNYDISVVLIYGTFEQAMKYLDRVNNGQFNSIHWRNRLKRMFVGAVGALQINTNTKVLWVPDVTVAAHCILAMYSHLDGNFELTKALPKKQRTDDLRIDMLTQIKGISVIKAKTLLNKWGSIAELSSASVKEISDLDGFGRVTANRILKTLNEEKEVKE